MQNAPLLTAYITQKGILALRFYDNQTYFDLQLKGN